MELIIPEKKYCTLQEGGWIIRGAKNYDRTRRKNESQGPEILHESLAKGWNSVVEPVDLLWLTRGDFGFALPPEARGPDAKENLDFAVRGGVGIKEVTDGVGMIAREVAAKCSREESEWSASYSYSDEPWATTPEVDAEEEDIFCKEK